MANELGKIERPLAEPYRAGRKLYLVLLIYSSEEAPADYVEIFERYWAGVGEHLANLESKVGKVSRIYHESISFLGEEGLKVLERLNRKGYELVKTRCEEGACFEAVEDRELVGETFDWERCLVVGLSTRKALEAVSRFYLEATAKRYEHIAKRINESLGEGEAALLFISEGHRVQFPEDIQVFYLAPPALDEVRRWLREQERKKE